MRGSIVGASKREKQLQDEPNGYIQDWCSASVGLRCHRAGVCQWRSERSGLNPMKLIVLTARLAAVLLVGLASRSEAQLSAFSGAWQNTDPTTRTLTKLRIDVVGTGAKIHAWGKCVPSDCPWGVADGTAYGPSGQSSLADAARVISAVFVTRVAEELLVIHPLDQRRLRVELLTRYTDHSGRPSVNDVAMFQRVSDSATGYGKLCEPPFDSAQVAVSGCVLRDQSVPRERLVPPAKPPPSQP